MDQYVIRLLMLLPVTLNTPRPHAYMRQLFVAMMAMPAMCACQPCRGMACSLPSRWSER